ncbi:MAG TPA: hypothetical protein VGM17_10185, partial [Rhizomicrobium sp.]
LRSEIDVAGQNNVGAPYHGTPNFDGDRWLSQVDPNGPEKIICSTPASFAPETLPAFFDPFRVRGTTDTLTSDRTSAAFATATPATISFNYNGLTKTRTDAFQIAVGYDFLNANPTAVKNDNSLVGYVAGNRNVTITAGLPSKFSVEYADLGLIWGHTYNSDNFVNIISASPHYLIDTMDDSRLFGIHAVEQPIFLNQNLPLNYYWFIRAGQDHPDQYVIAIGPLWDLRADADFYTDRGNQPSTNLDYFRLGSRFGVQAQIPMLRSTMSVADTWMSGFSGGQNRLNDLQALWTVHLDPQQQYFGLSFGYKIGRVEATGQREQSWLVSLTGKY